MTGDDVTRIARALSLEPWFFTELIPAADASADGLSLEAGGALHHLVLKRAAFAESASGETCSFLIHLADGSARCGLGALRPGVCRVFPARRAQDSIALEPGGCTCDWSAVPIERSAEQELAAAESARERYVEVVARWNSFVGKSAPATPFSARDFGRFLLDAYAQ